MATIVGGHFGRLPDLSDVSSYTLTNDSGMQVTVLGYGARLAGCRVPDRNGLLADVVLGPDTAGDWFVDTRAMGATVGRVANRIANARFELDGDTVTLPANEGDHHLHGGHKGFDRQLWYGVIEEASGDQALSMYLDSADGDQGYPGRLAVRQRFSLDARNTLTVETMARASAPTLFAPTLHPYFNLSGDAEREVGSHELQTPAAHWMPVDAQGIPTGALEAVDNTPFDFRGRTAVGARWDDDALTSRGGYDHALVLDGGDDRMRLAAILTDAESGRRLAIATTMPTVQLYVPRDLPAVCLEPQHHPDAINNPELPSPILRPDTPYYARTTYRFDTLPAHAGTEEPDS